MIGHKLKINMTGHKRGTVELDGFKLNATAVEFRASTDDINRAVIHVNVGEVEIEGEVEVGLVASILAANVKVKTKEPK